MFRSGDCDLTLNGNTVELLYFCVWGHHHLGIWEHHEGAALEGKTGCFLACLGCFKSVSHSDHMRMDCGAMVRAAPPMGALETRPALRRFEPGGNVFHSILIRRTKQHPTFALT